MMVILSLLAINFSLVASQSSAESMSANPQDSVSGNQASGNQKSLLDIFNSAKSKVSDTLNTSNSSANSNNASSQKGSSTRPARSIKETELFKLYEKYPLEKSAEWPRVAITVDSYTWAHHRDVAPDGNECWVMHAKIWYNAKKSKNVDSFSACGHGADITYTEDSTAEGRSRHNMGAQFSKWSAGWATIGHKHTGNRRTDGPAYPQKPLPSSPTDTITASDVDSHLHIILTNMGYDYSQDDYRVWFVKFSNGTTPKGEW